MEVSFCDGMSYFGDATALKTHVGAQRRSGLLRVAGKVKRGVVRLQRAVRANEKLLIVASSSCIMSVSHTALRPVLPVFAKVSHFGGDRRRQTYRT